ncbi:hypothetical protein F5Y17DRAFT_9012 [Xylariaceae sp. FL0594]|nr:hypothetical protein F5Y17DRAFT_9012 [Xylariaceae sp. FL0594]
MYTTRSQSVSEPRARGPDGGLAWESRPNGTRRRAEPDCPERDMQSDSEEVIHNTRTKPAARRTMVMSPPPTDSNFRPRPDFSEPEYEYSEVEETYIETSGSQADNLEFPLGEDRVWSDNEECQENEIWPEDETASWASRNTASNTKENAAGPTLQDVVEECTMLPTLRERPKSKAHHYYTLAADSATYNTTSRSTTDRKASRPTIDSTASRPTTDSIASRLTTDSTTVASTTGSIAFMSPTTRASIPTDDTYFPFRVRPNRNGKSILHSAIKSEDITHSSEHVSCAVSCPQDMTNKTSSHCPPPYSVVDKVYSAASKRSTVEETVEHDLCGKPHCKNKLHTHSSTQTWAWTTALAINNVEMAVEKDGKFDHMIPWGKKPAWNLKVRYPRSMPIGNALAVHNHKFRAIIANLYGRVLTGSARCSKCKGDTGIFTACIVFPTAIGGSCSNCYYHKSGHACTLKTTDPADALSARAEGYAEGGDIRSAEAIKQVLDQAKASEPCPEGIQDSRAGVQVVDLEKSEGETPVTRQTFKSAEAGKRAPEPVEVGVEPPAKGQGSSAAQLDKRTPDIVEARERRPEKRQYSSSAGLGKRAPGLVETRERCGEKPQGSRSTLADVQVADVVESEDAYPATRQVYRSAGANRRAPDHVEIREERPAIRHHSRSAGTGMQATAVVERWERRPAKRYHSRSADTGMQATDHVKPWERRPRKHRHSRTAGTGTQPSDLTERWERRPAKRHHSRSAGTDMQAKDLREPWESRPAKRLDSRSRWADTQTADLVADRVEVGVDHPPRRQHSRYAEAGNQAADRTVVEEEDRPAERQHDKDTEDGCA